LVLIAWFSVKDQTIAAAALKFPVLSEFLHLQTEINMFGIVDFEFRWSTYDG
jgi:hypothetical protein